ncbi:MAG TPA: hypothetical protein PLB54_06730, partial [Nitrosomonas sp.]|nr:hypothetical protein [Nitrosomonas sp.]
MRIQTLRMIVAVLMTAVVMLYIYTDREKDYYKKSAEPAVTQILTEISNWKKETLLKHLAPEAKQIISEEQLEKLLQQYQKLGHFRSVKEINFSRTASAFSLMGEKRINYSGIANFDNAAANLNITLIERGG